MNEWFDQVKIKCKNCGREFITIRHKQDDKECESCKTMRLGPNRNRRIAAIIDTI